MPGDRAVRPGKRNPRPVQDPPPPPPVCSLGVRLLESGRRRPAQAQTKRPRGGGRGRRCCFSVSLTRGGAAPARLPASEAMADEELEALRKQRLAELQSKHGDPSSEIAQQESKQREVEMRNNILAQVLDQAARARLSNLALVKPEKAKAVENYLIQMARFGQLGGKVSEQGLIEILEKVSQQTDKKTTVKFNRRKVLDSDEED